jgi:hypothetical protein
MGGITGARDCGVGTRLAAKSTITFLFAGAPGIMVKKSTGVTSLYHFISNAIQRDECLPNYKFIPSFITLHWIAKITHFLKIFFKDRYKKQFWLFLTYWPVTNLACSKERGINFKESNRLNFLIKRKGSRIIVH